jgi:hypothetical protein
VDIITEDMYGITEDMKIAVKQGTFWLDENYPGWAERIDLDSLKMQSCENCVIGQAVMNKGYWQVIETASSAEDMGIAVEWAIRHGFDADHTDMEDDEWYSYTDDGSLGLSRMAKDRYLALEVLWTDEVRKRLG